MTALRDVFLIDPLPLAALVLAAVVLTGATAHATVFRLALFRSTAARPVVGPFFASATTIFALFLAFMAADAWTRNGTASHARQGEVTAIERIGYTSRSLGDEGAPIAAALRTYVQATVSGEWIAQGNRRAHAPALDALGELERTVVRAHVDCTRGTRPPPCVGDVLADSLLRAIEDLHEARTLRLATAGTAGNPLRWSMLLAMAYVSFVAVALIHVDRPATAVVGSIVFGANVALAITMIALYEFPYGGLEGIEPGPLLSAIGAG